MCWLCNFRSEQLAAGEVEATPFQLSEFAAAALSSTPGPPDVPEGEAGVKPREPKDVLSGVDAVP